MRYVLLGLSLVLVLIWQQIQSTRLGYRVEQSRSQAQAQENLNAYLRMELQQAKSPARLIEQARRRLRMEQPAPASIVVLSEGPASQPNSFLVRLFGP